MWSSWTRERRGEDEKPIYLRLPDLRWSALPEWGSFACPKGHSFDRAKSGYVNLLLPGGKHAKLPRRQPDDGERPPGIPRKGVLTARWRTNWPGRCRRPFPERKGKCGCWMRLRRRVLHPTLRYAVPTGGRYRPLGAGGWISPSSPPKRPLGGLRRGRRPFSRRRASSTCRWRTEAATGW